MRTQLITLATWLVIDPADTWHTWYVPTVTDADLDDLMDDDPIELADADSA